MHESQRSGRRFSGWLIVTVLVILGSIALLTRSRPIEQSESLTQRARLLSSVGDDEGALELAVNAVELNPENTVAAMIAARSCESLEDFDRAVEWLERVSNKDTPQREEALLLQSRILQQQLQQLRRAEQALRDLLKVAPDHPEGLNDLARLLLTCARRHEAIPFILRLIRNGVETDLVLVLSKENVVISSQELLTRARVAAPDDPTPLTGLAWHHADTQMLDAAIDSLELAIEIDPDFVPAWVALGPLLLSNSDTEKCGTLVDRLPDQADRFPETWLVRAHLAEQAGSISEAAHCYLEAVRLAPESREATSQLARLLAQLGRKSESAALSDFTRRQQRLWSVFARVLDAGTFSEPADAIELISACEDQGRLFEACAWTRLARASFPESTELLQSLQRLDRKIESIPLVQTVPSANPVAKIDLSGGQVSEARSETGREGVVHSRVPEPVAGAGSPQRISFQDTSENSGLVFRFYNGSAAAPTGKMFELTGGGIGIIDLDSDGYPDVFLSQGREWAGVESGSHRDILFRNESGESFTDITRQAFLSDNGFGQGVAIGDLNSDGFSDLYVANVARNALWFNNGDGTFSSVKTDSEPAWTTSCAIADINGDSQPDLLDINYLAAHDVFDRVCPDADGRVHQCAPFHFDAAPDRVLTNLGNGSFVDTSSQVLGNIEEGKGLGVVVSYQEGTRQPQILVANDTTPNQLLVPADENEPDLLVDVGVASGVALNENGKSEGCMGIAVADLNSDGLNEFLVTNFLNESNTLYWQASAGFFEDRTRTVRLETSTFEVLGFGAQFLDADLDGLPELFVANGHVDDLRDAGKPYRMPAQLFRWDGATFQIDEPSLSGPYFQKEWLGRSVARLDWNRDGRSDLLVGHLDDNYALLTNTSHTPGNFISVRLIGVESNRDAIGTTVRLRDAQRLQFQQVMAGDGYQCSNERRLVFGVGASVQAESIEVLWPSGRRQQFRDVPAQRHYNLVEGGQLRLAP